MFIASKAYSDFLIQIKNADAEIQKRKNSFLIDLAKGVEILGFIWPLAFFFFQ